MEKDYKELYRATKDRLDGQKTINMMLERDNKNLVTENARLRKNIQLLEEVFQKYAPYIKNDYDSASSAISTVLSTRVYDYGDKLSVRALNIIRGLDIEVFGELVTFTPNQILMCRNSGKKTLEEIENLLQSLGLKLGMKIVYNPQEKIYMVAKEKVRL